MDYLELGPVPSNEHCEQVGPNYNESRARLECRVFIKQLRRMFGEEPIGARLRVKSNPHDFGSYLEVAVYYDPNVEESVEYAFKLEEEYPENWDEEAMNELG